MARTGWVTAAILVTSLVIGAGVAAIEGVAPTEVDDDDEE